MAETEVAMWDEFNACKYLYLRETNEPEENSLRLVVEEAGPVGPRFDREVASGATVEGVRAIESDDQCRLFELIWPSCVAYCVLDESFASEESDQGLDGGSKLQKYRKSRFSDYVAQATFAACVYPDRTLAHWRVVCLDHVVDVVGWSEPAVRRLRPANIEPHTHTLLLPDHDP